MDLELEDIYQPEDSNKNTENRGQHWLLIGLEVLTETSDWIQIPERWALVFLFLLHPY